MLLYRFQLVGINWYSWSSVKLLILILLSLLLLLLFLLLLVVVLLLSSSSLLLREARHVFLLHLLLSASIVYTYTWKLHFVSFSLKNFCSFAAFPALRHLYTYINSQREVLVNRRCSLKNLCRKPVQIHRETPLPHDHLTSVSHLSQGNTSVSPMSQDKS